MLSVLIAASLAAQPAPTVEIAPEVKARIDRILAETPLVDGHNDLPYAVRLKRDYAVAGLEAGQDDLHTDMARLEQGRVGGQLWSVYISASVTGDQAIRETVEQIDIADRLIETYPQLEWAMTADEIERVHADGKIASLLGVEGGHQIGGSLAALRQFRNLGAIYMTLTHGATTGWADSATDEPKHDGLAPFGVEVVKEMNRIGMLVDLSHVTPAAMHDALDASRAPVIFSHSSARGVTDHPRNVPDDVLVRLKDNGGLVMVTFVPSFVNEGARAWGDLAQAERARLEEAYPLIAGKPDPAALEAWNAWLAANPAPKSTVKDVADHVDHVARVAGFDHVGIGGDYDGIPFGPEGLEDVSTYPNLFAELIARGWSDENLAKLAGGNFLRVLRAAEAVAADMDGTPASLDKPAMED